METCDVVRGFGCRHRRCEPDDGRELAAPPPELPACDREVAPLPAERGADEEPRADAVGLRGAGRLELTVGPVRDGAERGTITGLCDPPPPAGPGITRLLGAR